MNHSAPPSTPDPAELERMFCALVDGVISTEDFSRLEMLLATDRAVRDEYRRFMRVEYLLAWEIGYGFDKANRPLGPLRTPPGGASDGWPRGISRMAGAGLLAALLGGGLLAMIVVMAWGMRDHPQGRPMGGEAVLLTAEDAARWQADHVPALNGPVPSGPLRLEAGSAQITFPSGAVVAIRAPAQVEVLGRNRLFLRSGRITPFVPEEAKGFTVVSPGGEVVDFGTEFSIDVDASGKTDVFVIDGAVDVSGGHAATSPPMRLTQGFATRLTPAERDPLVTLTPLVVDHFDTADGPLLRRDVDADDDSHIVDGQLSIPLDASRRPKPISRIAIENDFSALVGRRSVISFKATLPEEGIGDITKRWMALVLYEGDGDPPMGTWPQSTASVLVSPWWTVGARVEGRPVKRKQAFRRTGREIGPHQVVVEIDDTPATRERLGGAGMSVTANGLEVVRDQPFHLGEKPRLAFQTHVDEDSGGQGYVLIDDFSVSVEPVAQPIDTAAATEPAGENPRRPPCHLLPETAPSRS